jgi:hypothetical protein
MGLLGCGGKNAPHEERQTREPTVRVEGGRIKTEKLKKGSIDSSPNAGDPESPGTKSK